MTLKMLMKCITPTKMEKRKEASYLQPEKNLVAVREIVVEDLQDLSRYLWNMFLLVLIKMEIPSLSLISHVFVGFLDSVVTDLLLMFTSLKIVREIF